MRASVAAEMSGVGSVTVVGDGFADYARSLADRLGIAELPLAVLASVIMTERDDELRRQVRDQLAGQVVAGLLAVPAPPRQGGSGGDPTQIVFEGGLDEFHDEFESRLWTDGLPVVPPTLERVEAFMSQTPRSRDEVLGILQPDNREATIWSVAVNGVMAGCRSEHMPVLVAAVEAMCDPEFHLEYAGGTPGWEPLVIVGGPAGDRLGFNHGAGVMRVGRRSNTSVGRFMRLYLRNVAGLRIAPGQTDKATIGTGLNVAIAEDEEALRALGWPTYVEERGFAARQEVVTVISVQGSSSAVYSGGATALDHARTLAEAIGQGVWAHKAWTGLWFGQYHPLLVISPSVASVLARDGWGKDDLRAYFASHVKVTAESLERYAWQTGTTEFNLARLVEEGRIDPGYARSDDPERLLPAFPRADRIGIIVAGDPSVNQARGYVQNHRQGPPVSKRMVLPS